MFGLTPLVYLYWYWPFEPLLNRCHGPLGPGWGGPLAWASGLWPWLSGLPLGFTRAPLLGEGLPVGPPLTGHRLFAPLKNSKRVRLLCNSHRSLIFLCVTKIQLLAPSTTLLLSQLKIELFGPNVDICFFSWFCFAAIIILGSANPGKAGESSTSSIQ